MRTIWYRYRTVFYRLIRCSETGSWWWETKTKLNGPVYEYTGESFYLSSEAEESVRHHIDLSQQVFEPCDFADF